VAAAPGFGMTLEPEELSVVQGSSGQTVLTVTPLNGFSGTVELSLEGLDGAAAPEGIGLSPASVEVAGTEAVEQPLTLTVAEGVEPGGYELRVRGTSGQLSSAAALRLEVLREVPPVAQLTASPNSGEAPLFVGFDIEAYDPDGGEVTCTLDFGDETPPASSCSGYTHTYTEGGSYTAELKVRDDEGNEVMATAVVEVDTYNLVGSVRVVLTWGENPDDLDAHLIVPPSENRENIYHVYFGDMGNCENDPWACLDRDDTTGFGPETITITNFLNGEYLYFIHWYGGSGSWASSEAKIAVYDDSGFVVEFPVINNDNEPLENSRNVWIVFKIENRALTLINILNNINNFPFINYNIFDILFNLNKL